MNIGSRVLGRSNWRRGVLVFCLVMVAWGVRDHINFTDYASKFAITETGERSFIGLPF